MLLKIMAYVKYFNFILIFKRFFIISISVSISTYSIAQVKDTVAVDYYKMSLYKLISIKTTTASSIEEKISEAPAVIEVITELDIKEKGFRSVSDALQSVTGFFVTTDHVTQNASIRGINSGRNASTRNIKVMINGQPIAFKPTSENLIGTELIPIGMIKQIEVIKGPASALYGENAFLGVVNIITKTAKDMNNSSFLSYGSGTNLVNEYELVSGYNKKNLDFTFGLYSAKVDRSGLSIPFSTQTLKEQLHYEFPEKSPLGIQTKNDLSRTLSLYSNLSAKYSFGTFNTSLHFQELDNDGRFYNKNPILNTNRINILNYFIKESFNGKYMNEKLAMKLSITYTGGKIADKSILDYHPQENNGFKIEKNLGCRGIELVSEINYNWLDKVNIMAGVDYSTDKHELLSYRKILKSTNKKLELVSTVGENEFNNLGIYGQGKWIFTKKGAITGGIRYDRQNIYGDKINYRIGLVYTFSKYLFSKLLRGTSYRAPSPAQLFSPEPPYNPTDGTIGNPDLIPESAVTNEFLITYTPLKVMSFQLNGFYNLINSAIVIERKAGISKPVNLNEITSIGLEFSNKVKIKNLLTVVNISWQNSSYTEEDGNESDMKLFPNLMVNTGLTYTFKNFNLHIQSYYFDDYIASQNNIQFNVVLGESIAYKIKEYYLTDITLITRNVNLIRNNNIRKETIFSFSIKNIFDREFNFPGYYKYDIPALGRTISLKISQQI